jgi:hypothetical protein
MVQHLPFGRRGKGFRYLEFLSAIDDPGDGVGKLARITRTISEQARSYRGFNFFDEKDENILPAIARGEFNVSGMQSRMLRSLLPRYNSSQISRILKRLRIHGLLRKAPRGSSTTVAFKQLTAARRTTAGSGDLWTAPISTARPFSSFGRWIRSAASGRACREITYPQCLSTAPSRAGTPKGDVRVAARKRARPPGLNWRQGNMNLTVEIPDEIAASLGDGGDLPRRILEGFALEEYKTQRISKAQLRRLLGLETRYELDGFLKAHQVDANVTIEDVRRDLQDLKSLGF